MRAAAFVDGRNTMERLREQGIDYTKVCAASIPHRIAEIANGATGDWAPKISTIHRTWVYAAVVDNAAPPGDEADLTYRTWIKKHNLLSDTQVKYGWISGAKRRSEKGVDILLAVDALVSAYSGRLDAIILVTSDSDFLPLIDAIRNTGVTVILGVFSKVAQSRLLDSGDRVVDLSQISSDQWGLHFQFPKGIADTATTVLSDSTVVDGPIGS